MISIELNMNCDVLHKDITLSAPVVGLHCVADSYYFFLDESIGFETDECERRINSLKSLLQGWVVKIQGLNISNTCFLPFDFSDEYIGCFRIELLVDNRLELSYGFTRKIQGHSINPSKSEQFCITEADFIVGNKDFRMDKTNFIKDIEDSIIKLDVNESKPTSEELEDIDDVSAYDEAKKEDDGERILFDDYLKSRAASKTKN